MGGIFSRPKPPPPRPPVIDQSQANEKARLDAERKEKNRQAMGRKKRRQRGGMKLLLSDRNDSVLGLGNEKTLG